MLNRLLVPGAYHISIPEDDVDVETWSGALHEVKIAKSVPDEVTGNTKNINRRYFPQGIYTQKIAQYFTSNRWHQYLIELTNLDSTWVNNWGLLDQKFLERCRLSLVWHSLRAGYEEDDWHVDALRQVIHGLFYLQPAADERCTTVFSTVGPECTEDTVVSCSSGPGQGWVILQNGRSWHRGRNLSEQPRFGLKFAYNLWP